MKRFQTIACAVALILTLAMFSCNDPLQIGTELLEQGDVSFATTDTVSITALTTQLDSVIAYQSPNFLFTNQRLGWVSDPIFGSHKSELFVQILPETFIRPEGTVDSVVLSIQYDTLSVYGEPDATFDFELFSLFGGLSRYDTYYTDGGLFAFGSLGVVNGYSPVQGDSIDVIEIDATGTYDTLQVPNGMRIRLNNSFGETLFNIDSTDYTAVDTFLNAFSGILIRPTQINGGMMSLRTTNANATGGVRPSKVAVYYKNSDGEPRQYDYLIGGARFSLHDHDYSTGTVDGAIDNAAASEDLIYLQGAGGPSISLKFPYITSMTNVVINEAILEVTTAELLMDDRSKYVLPARLYTAYDLEGELILTSDISTALQAYRDITLVGGVPEEVTTGGTTSIVYRFNLSSHVQDMISGRVGNEIFLQHSQNSTGVERVIFKGINDTESPIKLKITYTEI